MSEHISDGRRLDLQCPLRGRRRVGARTIVAASVIAALWVGTAAAAEGTGCAAFKWPVNKEQALFADKSIQAAQSGMTLPTLPQGGIALALTDTGDVKFAMPPAGKPKDGAVKAAVLSIGTVPKAGTYQVTLSGEAWIDIIQDGKFVDSADHSGATGCDAVRKIVRFDLAAGPLEVQVSRASAASLNLAIEPVQ